MALAPVQLISDFMEDYPNYWLKFYEQGTTTPLAMAIDSSGSPTVAKAEISAGPTPPLGLIKTAGNATFIPYLEEAYDAFLFPTEAEADANDTVNAIQIANDVSFLQSLPSEVAATFGTVALMAASTDLVPGDVVGTAGYTTAGDGAGSDYIIAGPQSVDEIIDHTLANSNVALRNIIRGDVAVFPTVAAMVADATGALSIGYQIITQGYYAANDGGGALYDVVANFAADNFGDHDLNRFNNVAKLSTKEGNYNIAKQYGVVGDGSTDDTAALVALDGGLPSTVSHVDLGGLILQTTVTLSALVLEYFNGEIRGNNSAAAESTNPSITPYFDSDIQLKGSKSRLLGMAGKDLLWLGTSIPHQGEPEGDSYAQLVARRTGTKTDVNMAWSGSHAFWDDEGDPEVVSTIAALSMTEPDRLVKVAEFPGSLYDDTDSVTKASLMTADYRIAMPMEEETVNVVVLDHNHNDRLAEFGILEDNLLTLTGTTIGATTTVFDVPSNHGFEVGDGVGVNIVGIPELGRGAGRCTGKSANTVTVAIDSTAYTGSFESGKIQRFERTTVAGSFGFLIFFIGAQVFINNYSPIPNIILVSSPSNFTNGAYDKSLRSNADYIRQIAEHHELAYFDLITAFQLASLEDDVAYMSDGIHPLTPAARRAFADQWEKWLAGGVTRNPTIMQESVSPWVAVEGSPVRENFGTLGSPGYKFSDTLNEAVGMSFTPPIDWGAGDIVGVEINFWPPTGGTVGQDIVFSVIVMDVEPGDGLGSTGTSTLPTIDIPIVNAFQTVFIPITHAITNKARLLTVHVGRKGANGNDTWGTVCYISSVNIIFQPSNV